MSVTVTNFDLRHPRVLNLHAEIGDCHRGDCHLRGTAAVAMIVVLVVVNVIVVGITLGVSRDHDLTIRRLETIKAEYAAEAGINMAIREMIKDKDEDGDGTIGRISDDSNANNDPALGTARFYVTSSYSAPLGKTTLTSEGRCGVAKRKMVAEVYDS